MSFIGKVHEISLYGVIISIVSLILDKVSFGELYKSGFCIKSFEMFFKAYLFWSLVLFVPIAVICAFITKYRDDGEGLTFKSDKVVVIMFAHIAEELLGLLLTPIWFLKDIITKNIDDGWKKLDYITYAMELIFIIIGMIVIWK